MGTKRANAVGLLVEQESAVSARRVNGLGLLVEIIESTYVRPDPIVECAPDVDSVHRPTLALESSGPALLAAFVSAEVDATDSAGPAVSAIEGSAEVTATDNAGPMLLATQPSNAAGATDSSGPTLAGNQPSAQTSATDSNGPMLAANQPSASAAATDSNGPTLSGLEPATVTPATDSSGPMLLADQPSSAVSSSDNAGPTLSGNQPNASAATTPAAGPTVSGDFSPTSAPATDSSGPAVFGLIPDAQASSTDSSGPTLLAGEASAEVASSASAGPMLSGDAPKTEAPTTANAGPAVSGLSVQAEVDATDSSGPMLLANEPNTAAATTGSAGPYSIPAPADSSHRPASVTVQAQTNVQVYHPGSQSTQGISIEIYRPVITPGNYNPEGIFLRSLNGVTSGWSHNISVEGGYSSASLTIDDTRENIDDWLENGLNRHVVVFSEAGERIWEGFVNTVEARLGALNWVRGPVMDIANRVLVNYSPLDTNIDPPVTGATTETEIAEDTDSQAIHGVIELVLSGGTLQPDDAVRYRDTYLYESAWPQQSKDIAIGGGAPASISLGLLGYSAYLEKYIYTSDDPSFITISDKIKAVLTADPNDFYDNFYGIQDNAYIVPAYVEDRQTTAATIIQGLRELGDVNDLPWTFGVYANRRAVYAPQATEYAYFQRLSDPMQRIYDNSGNWVRPWNVLPGRWLFIEDVMVGYPRVTNPRKEPRALYIEEVSYSAPWGLQLRGSGGAGRLKQYLAKLSLGGR